MVEDGTAIGTAILNSINRLRESKAKSKVVILLTDGENNAGEVDPITAAKAAKALGIKIYTIGVGKQGGAPVPIPAQGGRMVYARNPDGTLYLTQIDEDTLKEIARITGGQYYRATDEQALDEIYKKILEMERTAFEVKHFKQRKELAKYILPFGILAMLGELVLVTTFWRKIP